MIGTLSLEATNLTELQFSNTLRIISAFVNKQPYAIRFSSTTDTSMATGLDFTTSTVEFLAPISFLN